MEEIVRNDWEVIRFRNDSFFTDQEVIATESPFTIVVNGEEFATIVCTPTNMRELLVGFLASEGIIRFYDDIESLTVDQPRGFAYVDINTSLKDIHKNHSKRFIGSC